MLKHLPTTRETCVRSLGREDPLEKEMATHSSNLAWRIPAAAEPGGLPSGGSRRVGHDWSDLAAAAACGANTLPFQPSPLRHKPGWKVKVKPLSRVRLFATPVDCRSRGSSVHGLPFPSPGDLPDPGIEHRSPPLQADTLTSEPPGNLSSWVDLLLTLSIVPSRVSAACLVTGSIPFKRSGPLPQLHQKRPSTWLRLETHSGGKING